MQSDNALETRRVVAAARIDVPKSFAVDQVRGMFELKKEKVAAVEFSVEVPVGDAWQIGAIVGPSGSGKSTVARQAFGEDFISGFEWDPAKAVVDHFPEQSIKQVTQVLTSVGFSSPPAWIKPHHVLSGGERFRCDLARALLLPRSLIAFDEFTSVVDRTVAKIGSAAIAKTIRKGEVQKQFVAVTCHYDVLEWLEPDWVLDMASGQLARGQLRRPSINLTVAPIHRGAWELFRRHHYLNTKISPAAKCFVFFWGEQPVAFSAWVRRMTKSKHRNAMREHRTVVLPDYQGIGIGNRVSEFCASIFTATGQRAFSTTSHPSMIHYRNASSRWKVVRIGMVTKPSDRGVMRRSSSSDSRGRVTGGFQYIGPPCQRLIAEKLLEGLKYTKPIGRIFDQVLEALSSSAKTRQAILRNAGLSAKAADKAIRQLEKYHRIDRFRVGKRVFYSVAQKKF